MDYWPTNHNKKVVSKKLSVEFRNPLAHSENNNNDIKSDSSNLDKETLNLFKGIVKVTQRTLKEKKTPETLSNTMNNNNNIFDFANFLYNNEEHLDDDKSSIIKNPENANSLQYKNVMTPSATLKSKAKRFDKSPNSLNLSVISKGQNIKKSLFKKNSNKLTFNYNNNNNNNIAKRRQKRGSVMGDLTHKHRNSHNFNFFFKLKEKEKIPSKTPYLDKIWNASNKLNYKHNTNIHSKKNSDISLVKQNSQEIKTNKISKTNIKNGREKDEIISKSIDKIDKDRDKENIGKKQKEKIEENENKILDKNVKIIFWQKSPSSASHSKRTARTQEIRK